MKRGRKHSPLGRAYGRWTDIFIISFGDRLLFAWGGGRLFVFQHLVTWAGQHVTDFCVAANE